MRSKGGPHSPRRKEMASRARPKMEAVVWPKRLMMPSNKPYQNLKLWVSVSFRQASK